MDNWITIFSFTLPHEAHIAKGRLESEGIEVLIKDELTAQVNNFYSNAIGGVKLQVRDLDFDKAVMVLIDAGYINEKEHTPNKFWTRFDKLTAKIPLVGNSIIELRLIIIVALILLVTIVPIVFLSLPSALEKLTENIWCVDKIYYNGQEITPYSIGFIMESEYSSCSETMSFGENGIAELPGINSFREIFHWELKDDSLIITSLSAENNYSIEGDLLSGGDTIMESIYPGTYHLEIGNNIIRLESKNLIIIGEVYSFNY
ncbi:MAG: hypothetical protein A2W91_00785 [Bacteroidetes bacterium GWF2_38_335]|nr:MAG: hypothetical protein A2W91_00785 [Bacteroidetes bacterium GWF2_38_335]OFY78368.1 MAG: hypothetical protein A2281_04165 [Bacteroidetes bacterium RIFOXYA12_FULL_38_20]HBS87435.1 hypothetical protein [Bacteroidales bacterium]